MADNKKNNPQDSLLVDIKTKFKETKQAWEPIRKASVADVKFASGEQADPTWESAARAKGRGNLIQVNRLMPFVQQIENMIRDSNPTISVHPTDEAGSEETARVMQGMIRRIENISSAQNAYMSAAGKNGALIPGFGFIKLETDYISSKSFLQDIFIREVKDPFKILPDFNALSSDFSDASFWFEFEDISKDEYKRRFPKSKLGESKEWELIGERTGDQWIRDNQVRIARYWYRETKPRTLILFEDGTTGFADEYGLNSENETVGEAKLPRPIVPTSTEDQELFIAEQASAFSAGQVTLPEDERAEFDAADLEIPTQREANVIDMRLVHDSKVVWCDSNGFEILDQGEWHNDDFPFVAVVGTDQIVDGKRKIYGIIRFAKDSQKMFNYTATNLVRKIAAANQSPWIADFRSIPENMRQFWEKSNTDPQAILYYNGVDALGNPLPPPQRGDAYEPAIDALLKSSIKFEDDLKASLGVYDASVGKGIGEDQSGKAIETLAQRGDQTNLHFSQNLVSGIRELGNKIIRLMPCIYDTARVVQIVNPDNKTELVKINQIFKNKAGQKTAYMMGEGTYGVQVDIGPSYATRKAEQLAEMMEFVNTYPAAMPIIADLIAKNTDWGIKDELYERMYAYMAYNMPYLITPPELDEVPPNAKAFVVSLLKKADALQMQLNDLNEQYKVERFKNDANMVNNASKERVQQMKIIGDLQVERIRLVGIMAENQSRENRDQLKLEITTIQGKQKAALEAIKMIDKRNKEDLDREYEYKILHKELEQGMDKVQ